MFFMENFYIHIFFFFSLPGKKLKGTNNIHVYIFFLAKKKNKKNQFSLYELR